MREHVARVNLVADLHLKRAGPQMRIRGEMSVAEILDDVIAGERVIGNRYRYLAAVGDVLGNAVLHLDDLAVADRVNLLVPCVIAAVLALVAGIGVAVGAELDPVDRVALADVRLTVHRQYRAAMRRSIRRTVGREPVLALEWRGNDDRIVRVHLERGGVNRS